MRVYLEIIMVFSLVFFIPGCATQETSLLERRSKRLIAPKEPLEEIIIRKLILTPASATSAKEGVEITVSYLSREYLDEFFKNEAIFGRRAKINPYFPDLIVFYVKIFNKSGGRIRIEPEGFTLLDGLRGQYSYLPPSYIVDLFGARSTAYSIARTTEESAPGLYGMPLRMTAGSYARGKRRTRLGLLKQVSLTSGYIYDNVIYDGYVAFPKPPLDSEGLTLILADIQTTFDSAGRATDTISFRFSFEMEYQ